MVVTMHCTMSTGNPSMPVRRLTTCPMADSSETMYRKSVTSDMKLRYSAAKVPYRCLVHSVRTKPSGHLRRIIGPSAAKISKGRPDDRA
jgi:hypothetical protein